MHAHATLPCTHAQTARPFLQVGNDEAIAFYKRFGFEVLETLFDYYKKLDPPDAVVLVKRLS